MKTLLDALANEYAARSEHEAACLAVWEALKLTYPKIAGQVSLLFTEDAAAARWVCAHNKDGLSPANRIAAGQMAEVEKMLLRALNGFGA